MNWSHRWCVLLVAMMVVMGCRVSRPSPVTGLSVHPVFAHHMVLQRDVPIRVWGWADAHARVTVTLGNQSESMRTGRDGAWEVEFDALPAGGPHVITVQAGDERREFTDVLIGDVWIAAGQSNMEWPLAWSTNATREIAAADWPEIRLLKAHHQIAVSPQETLALIDWRVCSPESVAMFAAPAYFMARDLHEALDVPIGMIDLSWGGAGLPGWTRLELMEGDALFAPEIEQREAWLEQWGEELATGDEFVIGENPHHIAGFLFNSMVVPLRKFAIRGVAWCQGETDVARHAVHRELLTRMVRDWRSLFGDPELPFVTVQLSAFNGGWRGWPDLQWAQAQVAEDLEQIALVVTNDMGVANDLHYLNKAEVGRRLTLAALALLGAGDEVGLGPECTAVHREGARLVLAFDRTGGGLIAEGMSPDHLRGFEIQTQDGVWVAVAGRVVGERIELLVGQANPIAVRYHWIDWPEGHLVNAEGLPLGVFVRSTPGGGSAP